MEPRGLTSPPSRSRTQRGGIAFRVPPVRTVDQVMRDPHMHERGFLQEVDHPDFGPATLPNSPLRLHGAGQVPSCAEGQRSGGDNAAASMAGCTGLSTGEIEAVARRGRGSFRRTGRLHLHHYAKRCRHIQTSRHPAIISTRS